MGWMLGDSQRLMAFHSTAFNSPFDPNDQLNAGHIAVRAGQPPTTQPHTAMPASTIQPITADNTDVDAFVPACQQHQQQKKAFGPFGEPVTQLQAPAHAECRNPLQALDANMQPLRGQHHAVHHEAALLNPKHAAEVVRTAQTVSREVRGNKCMHKY